MNTTDESLKAFRKGLYELTIERAIHVSNIWKHVPAPQRGELIRLYGEVLREQKEKLARAITVSIWKTIRESRGEVQEAIDMCDFAVGLSRQLYGLTMPSERPEHRLQETWQPFGVVGVISAFNFPCAVFAWNFCLAAVCGNAIVWKPSEKSPGVAIPMQMAWDEACDRFGHPEFRDVFSLISGGVEVGKQLCEDKRIALISATGSVRMGKQVAQTVGARLGKVLLELGGNNSAIVSDKCDLGLAVKGCVFGAVGTTGQRCTTLRRVFVHENICDEFVAKMITAYKTIKIGNPLDEEVLIGPLVDEEAYNQMFNAIKKAKEQGALGIFGGDRIYPVKDDNRTYVTPCIITSDSQLPIMQEETFAPVLYVIPYSDIHKAISMSNDVSQGLSSCIFTNDVRESELFVRDSYTGLINVNTSPSGAEIGGAFGGEKDTGGGRESGSDAWKNYMRRVTSAINFSGKLPLAQGIKFD